MVSISPTREEGIESDLVRLERENKELRRQLDTKGWEEQRRGRGDDEKYEELMREVIRIQNTVDNLRGSSIHLFSSILFVSGRKLKDNL